MAFGTGYVRKRRRPSPKRRNSDERLKATLAGLGATAAAIAAAKAARNGGRRPSEVIAVKENRRTRKSNEHHRPGSRYGDDEWEDLPDDGTSDSSSDAGLVYGDWRGNKSQESLASNDSGTNKWGWRWGFGKKKRRSSDNLNSNTAFNASSTSLAGAAAVGAAGALTGAAVGTALGRHDSETSSIHTLQSVYPVAPNDPTASFDARRTSLVHTPQPVFTSGTGAISIQQPQPIPQIPGAIYSTQASSQPGYVAPAGPPVFSQAPSQYQTQNVIVQSPQYGGPPPGPRRANSSPIKSSWKRDAAIAGLAATAGAAAFAATKSSDRPSRTPSNVQFSLTQEQVAKEEREQRRARDRREEEESRRRERLRREDDLRREEEDRIRREQLRRDEDARRVEEERRREQLRREDETRQEEERRHRELQRQQEESRRYMEAERLAKIESDRRIEERRRQEEEMRAREIRERERLELEARAEAKRKADLEAEREQMQRERRETERREAEAARLEAEKGRRRKEQATSEYATQYEDDRQQRTESSMNSIAPSKRRKGKESEDRVHNNVKSDDWKSSAAGTVAAGAAVALAGAAIASYADAGKEERRERDRKHDRRQDSFPEAKKIEASDVKSYAASDVKSYEPTVAKPYTASNVMTFEPSNIKQDYFEDDFDPNLFKKDKEKTTEVKESQDKKTHIPKANTTDDVFQDWEDRYNAKPVSQADFFMPQEFLKDANVPGTYPIDPNEGATDIHISQAHEDSDFSRPIVPPYPLSYAFTATIEGSSSSSNLPWSVPSLNLIQATPPVSRANSFQSVSRPPSPNIEPIKEEPAEQPTTESPSRVRSRVSWGENQFHHFEVHTPDSHLEQFASDADLENHDKKYAHDEVTYEDVSPGSNPQTSTYQAYHPPKSDTSTYQAYRPGILSGASEAKDSAPSTQYVQDDNESPWDKIVGTASKKRSKKEKKDAIVAAAATGAVTTAALLALNRRDGDDFKLDTTSSAISNPFSDSHAAPTSVVSYAPSTVVNRKAQESSGFVEDGMSETPGSMHVPGGFDDDLPAEDQRNGKNDKNTNEYSGSRDVSRKRESERTKEADAESELHLSKKERRKKRSKVNKRASVDSWELSDNESLASTFLEREFREAEPSASPPRTPEKSYARERSDSGSNKVAAAAMASGFAALMGNSMKQDQDRMASDIAHARQSEDRRSDRDVPSSPPNGTRSSDANKTVTTPSSATFQDFEDPTEIRTPKRKKDRKHSTGLWSPTIGSPLRAEVKNEDYMATDAPPASTTERPLVEAPKALNESAYSVASKSSASRDVVDSGYFAPDDAPRKDTAERDSDEFFSAGSEEERERSKAKLRESPKSDITSSKYDDDDLDREERRHQHRHHESKPESREQSRDREYGQDENGERRRRKHHRRRGTDERDDDWDTKSNISEARSETRSETNGERRHKHRRRESERDGSTDSKVRHRSSASTETLDLHDERKHKRRSRHDGEDDNASVISSSSRHDEDRSSKKEKKEEKRSSGIFGLFSKSKESLVESPGKSPKSKDDHDDEHHKHRRRKHRSDRGSTYGSDDDDARSTISSGSRHEKRSSRSERSEGDRRDSSDKVHRSSHAR